LKTKPYFFSFVFFMFLFQILPVSPAGAVNKIMPLGDSITWDDRIYETRGDGEKVAYRHSLWQLLTNAGYEIDFVGSEYTGYDIFPGPEPDAENEGHPGWTDDQIANEVYQFLVDNPADIILLHIGTNDVDPDPGGVEFILNEIDRYEADSGTKIFVILARIINRAPYSATTTAFNDNVEDMAYWRVNGPDDPAYPDNIIFGVDVDMEDGAGIVYDIQDGDMYDLYHPNEMGYAKMANVWYSGLMEILPQAEAGPDQSTNAFHTVTLDASGSFDPKSENLSYQWTQTDGAQVILSDNQAALTTFVAPAYMEPNGEILTFKVTVTNAEGLESTDATSVTVLNCTGDFDNDKDVDGSDLATFAANFGRTDCGVPTTCQGDFDNDGDVDGSDLAVFAADFGRTDCPTSD
jgi:hypothetical protein